MALYIDDYSISEPRTGSDRVSDLVLTGWSNGSAWTEQGRMYWIATTADDFELYRKEAKASADKIASGAINATTGVVTLTADNTSGVTGSVIVTHTAGAESTGEVIVFYGDEPDMAAEYKALDTLLISTQWEGGVRFETALKLAKVDLDNMLRGLLVDKLRRNSKGELQLADIARPRQLAKVHALMALALVVGNRSNNTPLMIERAELFNQRAERKLKSTMLGLDFTNDDVIDSRPTMSGGKIIRG